MKNNINYLLCLMYFLGIGTSNAQFLLPEQCMTKYEDGTLKIKWEPSTIEEWESGMKNGYLVEVSEVNNSTVSLKQIIKPLEYSAWLESMKDVSPFKYQFYEGSRNFLYPEMIQDPNEELAKSLPGQTEESLDSFRLGFLIYSNIYDFNLAKQSGLAAEFNVRQGVDYYVKISTSGFDPIEKEIVTVEENRNTPEITGNWGDRVVEFTWNTFPTKDKYFGYFLELSLDGLNYELTDSLPYVNSVEKYAKTADSDFGQLSVNDSLVENYVNYYYRLRGFDYFGERSRTFTSTVGYGYEELSLSPILYFADQTEDNQAHIKWNVHGDQGKLIEKFIILRADSVKGEYTLAVDSIDADAREIMFPIEHEINHFRIEAVPVDGKNQSSMPVLVMGQDTVPPLQPDIISALLDSSNNVNITWYANTESDLWGYRIYKSNFKDDVFILLNSYPTLDTVFIDSIDIDLGNKDVFYLIEAADKRNNRSPFSDTLRIEVPDVIPPLSPVVSRVKQEGDSVKVEFERSISDDVVIHEIFRRDVENEGGWKLVAQIWNSDSLEHFYDKKVEVGYHYAYTIIARDNAGLESTPQHFKDLYIKKIKKEFIPFKSITQVLDKETNQVKLSWECNEEMELKSVLVYRGVDKDRMGKYKYIDAPQLEMVDDFKSGAETVYYRLKPVFEGQTKHYFSDYIEVRKTIAVKD